MVDGKQLLLVGAPGFNGDALGQPSGDIRHGLADSTGLPINNDRVRGVDRKKDVI